ncbi:MAG TPA: class I SAM-dependent methyltransferase [Roseiflexaceae bacterium]|nr:class I SAM-dependent methyltransferase [Roseiflexaceae bacterium]
MAERSLSVDLRAPLDAAPATLGFALACPACRAALEVEGDAAMCAGCGAAYRRTGGIWRLLLPERAAYFARFVAEYEAVRRAEGRGAEGPDYYRALPFADLSGRFREDWRIRARSFEALLRYVVAPLERGGRLRVLDLGAGCGWLAYRLAQRGHAAAAADLLTGERDGLGAFVHYDAPFLPVQAEFERLPLASGQLGLVVVNAALHYATDYAVVLREALRLLRPGGVLAVMDTPVYHDASSGAQMVRERGDAFERRYGFRGEALPCENYLSYRRLEELAAELGVRWRIFRPRHGLRWALRPLRARLRGRREPASFPLLVAYR